ncbi:MAG: 30S ribosome-binding factor RbfA [Candidatus Borkfalkiaceae bacterium]|nr:30S ribosome-binding factor RbfA [Christensenellaceae bacterium]
MKKNAGGVSRADRLNAEFKREISEIIARKLKDPMITAMVSVTSVDCSRDLSYAKVFVSVFSTDEEKKNSTFSALASDAKKIRYELGKSMRVRTVPELDFMLDKSIEYGDKMDKILLKLSEDGEK